MNKSAFLLKMNKRGIMLKHVAKIMLALIVIIGLLYLAYSLYDIFLAKSELEQARASLDKITGKIENLEQGEEAKVVITNPDGWIVKYYKEGINIDLCEENCLCVNDGIFSPENGVCYQIDEKIEFENTGVYSEFWIKAPLEIVLKKQGDLIKIYHKKDFEFRNFLQNFLDREVEFENNKKTISELALMFINEGRQEAKENICKEFEKEFEDEKAAIALDFLKGWEYDMYNPSLLLLECHHPGSQQIKKPREIEYRLNNPENKDISKILVKLRLWMRREWQE